MSEAKDRIGFVAAGCRWQTAGGVRAIARIVDGDVHYAEGGFDRRATLLNDPEYSPIAAPEAAKPQHPERRAVNVGDRLRWISTGDLYTVTRVVADWACTRRDGADFDGGFWLKPGAWEFADAPAPEATGKADVALPLTPVTPRCATCMASPCRCASALPAGKVEAASAHNFSDPYCHNFNRPDIGDTRMVRCCSACGRAKNADNIGGPCRPVPWREVFEARINRDYEATSVLRADTPQLIDRRLSYQPMDDSWLEDVR